VERLCCIIRLKNKTLAYSSVRLQVWIMDASHFHIVPSPLLLIHVSKTNMRKCQGSAGSLRDHGSGLQARCSKCFIWLSFAPKCDLTHCWLSITARWQVWELCWWMDQSLPAYFGYSSCRAWGGRNGYRTRATALWQHICLIFLAHLQWPVSVIIMCERACCICPSAFHSVRDGCFFFFSLSFLWKIPAIQGLLLLKYDWLLFMCFGLCIWNLIVFGCQTERAIRF